MTITITGPVKSGPSWNAIEQTVVSMLGDGRLTRISRTDGSANYRATSGRYDLTFIPERGDATEIVLVVNAATGGRT